MKPPAAKNHRAEFRRVTEHGSEFFRVRCLKTGHTAMYWPNYLREGSPLAIEDEPKSGSCFLEVDHDAWHRLPSESTKTSAPRKKETTE